MLLSYVPAEAHEEAAGIANALSERGVGWHDPQQSGPSAGSSTEHLLVILTPSFFKSPCTAALKSALDGGVEVVSCYPSRYDINCLLNEAPDAVAGIRSIASRKIDIRRAAPPRQPHVTSLKARPPRSLRYLTL